MPPESFNQKPNEKKGYIPEKRELMSEGNGKSAKRPDNKSAIEKAEGLAQQQEQKAREANAQLADLSKGLNGDVEKHLYPYGRPIYVSDKEATSGKETASEGQESDGGSNKKLFVLMNEVFDTENGGQRMYKKINAPGDKSTRELVYGKQYFSWKPGDKGVRLTDKGHKLLVEKDNTLPTLEDRVAKKGGRVDPSVRIYKFLKIDENDFIINPDEMYTAIAKYQDYRRQLIHDAAVSTKRTKNA